MSVRTEPRDLSQQLQQTLTIPRRADARRAADDPGRPTPPWRVAPVARGHRHEQHLHEANAFNTNNEHHPLERTVCINIRASLSTCASSRSTATWAPPSAEATKAIFQQACPRARHSNRPHRPQASGGGAGTGGRQVRSLSASLCP